MVRSTKEDQRRGRWDLDAAERCIAARVGKTGDLTSCFLTRSSVRRSSSPRSLSAFAFLLFLHRHQHGASFD